jgi:transcriptional regulator with GAF, ATPase, and Fis domain
MPDQSLLERTKREIRERLDEIEPLVAERDQLRAALEALEAGEGPKRASRRTNRQRGRPSTSRRAGRGERRTQLLELLRTEPGLRPAEAARRMGINPAQLHSLARRLEEGGELKRREGALYPAST